METPREDFPLKDAEQANEKTLDSSTGRLSQVGLLHETSKVRLQRITDHTVIPMDVEFRNINAYVSTLESKDKKQTLFDIQGYIKPGEFLALMGSSGAGKSTLLNVLGQRFEGEYSGEIFINGQPRNKQSKRSIGYVLQQEIILPNLTVRETLEITAKLRLPKHLTAQEKIQRVDDIIHLMGLATCENTVVQYTSGGEKKRVSIANEILTNPSILFLDEPTSGLDSTSAYSILHTLEELSNQGRTIICAIHQPSSQIFAKFNRLLLLASGRVVYFGETKGVTSYFENVGYPIPLRYNPADYMIELITDNFESEDEKLRNKPQIKKNLIEAWKSQEKKSFEESKNAVKKIQTDKLTITIDENKIMSNTKWNISWMEQFIILLNRAFKHRRGNNVSNSRAFEIVAVGVVAGLIWFRMKKTESNLQDWIAATFFIQVYMGFSTMYRGIIHFPSEKAVVMKERQSGSYRLSSYYLSKVLAEVPIDIFLPLLALTIFYWMVGLGDNFGTFIVYLIISCVGISTANSFGTFIGCAVMNMEYAMVCMAVVGLLMMLISGFLVKDRSIPDFISWLGYASFMKYSYQSGMLIIIDKVKFRCDDMSNFEECETSRFITRDSIIDFFGMDDRFWLSFLILWIQLLFWHILGYSFLRKNTQIKQDYKLIREQN